MGRTSLSFISNYLPFPKQRGSLNEKCYYMISILIIITITMHFASGTASTAFMYLSSWMQSPSYQVFQYSALRGHRFTFVVINYCFQNQFFPKIVRFGFSFHCWLLLQYISFGWSCVIIQQPRLIRKGRENAAGSWTFFCLFLLSQTVWEHVKANPIHSASAHMHSCRRKLYT